MISFLPIPLPSYHPDSVKFHRYEKYYPVLKNQGNLPYRIKRKGSVGPEYFRDEVISEAQIES